VPGVTAGNPPDAIAAQFASSINDAGCQGLIAVANGNVLQITVAGNEDFSLCVGGYGQQPTCCLPSGVVSCSFQPDIEEFELAGTDCNGNSVDDAIDIATGTSLDTDADGYPDECLILFICGDVNDDTKVDILDIVFLINYKYKDGEAPEPLRSGDVNSHVLPDGKVDILDIVYLINYKYKDGPEPDCP
jgi:hypothetical protein